MGNVQKSYDLGFLSVSAAAEALGISEATIRAWILYRRLEVVRIGRRVLIKSETLEALIARGTVPALKGRELV
jgi:excisionase family DNA binding protein